MLRQRSQAATMRAVFPQVGQLRIELTFSDSRADAPSPQVHTLYPAARAFFRFACPCSDCEGDFDLTPAVTQLLNGAPARQRALERVMPCEGAHFRGPLVAACPMGLKFRLILSLANAA